MKKLPVLFSFIKFFSGFSSYNHIGIVFYSKELDRAFMIDLNGDTYYKTSEGKVLIRGVFATPVDRLIYKEDGNHNILMEILYPSKGTDVYIKEAHNLSIGQAGIEVLKQKYGLKLDLKNRTIIFERKYLTIWRIFLTYLIWVKV